MAKEKQCAYWTLTINENAKCYDNIQNIINEQLESNPNMEYSYIKHNADEDDKNIHYHLVMYFKGKVKRFTTIQNIFEGAHIEQTNQQRYKRCIQYLIHKNNPEKQQYKPNEIISNLETSYLADILQGEGYDFELFQEEKLFDYFNEIYSQYGDISMQNFLTRFGLGAITKYYFVIKDQIKEYKDLMNRVKLHTRIESKEDKAFKILYKDLKQEYNLYCYHIDNSIDYEEYERQVYSQFIDNVNNGYIDLDKVINDFEQNR